MLNKKTWVNRVSFKMGNREAVAEFHVNGKAIITDGTGFTTGNLTFSEFTKALRKNNIPHETTVMNYVRGEF